MKSGCLRYCGEWGYRRGAKEIKREILALLRKWGVDTNGIVGVRAPSWADDVLGEIAAVAGGNRQKVISLYFVGLCSKIAEMTNDERQVLRSHPDALANEPVLNLVRVGIAECADRHPTVQAA